MKKIFVDADIFLDLLLDREPHAEYAAKIFDLSSQEHFQIYTTAVIFSNIYYILNDVHKKTKVRDTLTELRTFVRIQNVDEKILDQALTSSITDFEDAIQYYAAVRLSAECILTRNKKDYRKSELPVYTPQEWLGMHAK